MNLNNLAKECYKIAKSKGFWDEPRNFGELIALVHSELSECLEAHRKGITLKGTDNEDPFRIELRPDDIAARYLTQSYLIEEYIPGNTEAEVTTYLKSIKDCYELELADTIIRILDLCGGLNIPIQELVNIKLEYNKTRGYKHGKQY